MTTTVHLTDRPTSRHGDRPPLMHRFVGVVAQPGSYRRIAYLLAGLPLGTIWFTLLVSGIATSLGLLVVALIGIPLLWALWYVTRGLANVERAAANALLDRRIPMRPMAATARGNPWVRLRAMSGERTRVRELGFLMMRFPVGVATFTVAVTALTTPVIVAAAPFTARLQDEPFGDWRYSAELEDAIAGSPWSWLLVPIGAVLLITSFHVLHALADACGRWAEAQLGDDRDA